MTPLTYPTNSGAALNRRNIIDVIAGRPAKGVRIQKKREVKRQNEITQVQHLLQSVRARDVRVQRRLEEINHSIDRNSDLQYKLDQRGRDEPAARSEIIVEMEYLDKVITHLRKQKEYFLLKRERNLDKRFALESKLMMLEDEESSEDEWHEADIKIQSIEEAINRLREIIEVEKEEEDLFIPASHHRTKFGQKQVKSWEEHDKKIGRTPQSASDHTKAYVRVDG